jgi:AcrR family transcriptional regulator
LLQRAATVIAAEGVEALSLRGLARDLGVSHAAPARHFSGRAELLAALAENGADALVAATAHALEGCGPLPLDRLRAACRAYLVWALEHPAHYSAIRNPEVLRHAAPSLRAKMAGFVAGLRRMLGEAHAAGWHGETDPDLLMFQLGATLLGAATLLTEPLHRGILGDPGGMARVDGLIRAAIPDPPC